MDNEELVDLIQLGIDVNKNLGILYKQNETLIRKIVLPLSKYDEIEDLMQEAFLGLTDAVNHFDSSKDAKFMTYAPYRIRLHCIRYVQNNHTKRLPVHLLERIAKYRKLSETMDDESARIELKLNKKQFAFMKKVMEEGCVSLDKEIRIGDDTMTLVDTIADDFDMEQTVIDDVLSCDLWKTVNDALDDKYKMIIVKKYKKGQSGQVIADDVGLTRQRINQLEKKALKQLQKLQNIQELAESYGYDSSLAYKSGLRSFLNGQGSNVEMIAIKRLEIEESRKFKEKCFRKTMEQMTQTSIEGMIDRIDELCKEK